MAARDWLVVVDEIVGIMGSGRSLSPPTAVSPIRTPPARSTSGTAESPIRHEIPSPFPAALRLVQPAVHAAAPREGSDRRSGNRIGCGGLYQRAPVGPRHHRFFFAKHGSDCRPIRPGPFPAGGAGSRGTYGQGDPPSRCGRGDGFDDHLRRTVGRKRGALSAGGSRSGARPGIQEMVDLQREGCDCGKRTRADQRTGYAFCQQHPGRKIRLGSR